jgi:7-carboxy-7-deazaguanine synthase
MKIVEEFFTLQAEGKFLGVPSYFIRTTGCNLRCEWANKDGTTTKCDTPYTSWNPEKGQELNLVDVLKKMGKYKTKHVVITGGEPTIQSDLKKVVDFLINSGVYVTIETNVTKYIHDIKKAFMSISPKTLNSYNQDEKSIEKKIHSKNNNFIDAISKWTRSNDYQLKFVVNGKEDLKEIFTIQKSLNIPSRKIYLMPQGITTKQFKEKEKELFQICIENNFNYTPRLHIDIFGNIRGI